MTRFLSVILMLIPGCCLAIEATEITDVIANQVEKDSAEFAQRIGWKGYRYTSEVRRLPAVSNLPQCLLGLTAKANDSDIINNVRYKVTCSKAPGNQKWSVNVNTQINYFMDIATLGHAVKKDHVIEINDIVYVEKKIRKNSGYLFNYDQFIGQKTKRKMKTGSLLTRKDMQVDSLVSRNEEVLIVINHERLSMATGGVALKSGELGDTIKVKNKRSGNIITAIVIGKDKVAVKVY